MAKQEQEQDQSLVVGRNPVREALERGDGRIEKVLLQQGAGGRPIEAIRRAAVQVGVPVQFVPAARIEHLAGGLNHQGVVALSAAVEYLELEDMLAAVAPSLEDVQRLKPILLLLDQIQDPHNFGAILRSAVAAGASGVIVPRHHMAPLNAAAVKTSAGAALRIPIARTTNLADAVQQLKERGYWVAGATGEGTTSVWEMDWDRPLAIVLGNEGKGIRPHVAASCDYLVSIPMRGSVESLNASVAAGILLFAATRPRLGDLGQGESSA
ncbi:MAG TPA: 23S rRNA (guanosine(2251)-2'-O)-methyltransferase RlmB [Rhodothermales bacterium]|nr:23S rRNA (guanosine(2251)-2'-O)-methyltransferase RlmB [Rhodothermales bacterium]